MMNTQTTMTPAQKQLAEDHMHLVPSMIHALTRSYGQLSSEEREELTQNGYLALCRAAMNYDNGRSFRIYAQVVIKHAIYDYWRTCNKHQKWCCSLDALLYHEDDDSWEQPFFESTDCPSPEQDTQQTLVSEYLRLVSQQSCDMIQKGIASLLLTQKGYTSSDIARLYDVPSNRVRAWQSKAKKKLQQSQELYALLS